LIHRHSRFRVRLGEFSSPAHTCELAVDGGSFSRNLGKGRISLLVLTLDGQYCGRLKGAPGYDRLLGHPVLVTAPTANRDQNQDDARDDQVLVALPKLLEPLLAYLFINFLKNIRHFAPLNSSPAWRCRDLLPRPAGETHSHSLPANLA